MTLPPGPGGEAAPEPRAAPGDDRGRLRPGLLLRRRRLAHPTPSVRATGRPDVAPGHRVDALGGAGQYGPPGARRRGSGETGALLASRRADDATPAPRAGHRPGLERAGLGGRDGPRDPRTNPGVDVLVVDDGSERPDRRAWPPAAGAAVVRLPFNLGVGGAMRAGYRHALRPGYDVAVQIDADGQHDPRYLAVLVAALDEVDIVHRRPLRRAEATRTASAGRAAGRWSCSPASCSRLAGTTPDRRHVAASGSCNRRAMTVFADALPRRVPRRHRRVAGDRHAGRLHGRPGARRHAPAAGRPGQRVPRARGDLPVPRRGRAGAGPGPQVAGDLRRGLPDSRRAAEDGELDERPPILGVVGRRHRDRGALRDAAPPPAAREVRPASGSSSPLGLLVVAALPGRAHTAAELLHVQVPANLLFFARLAAAARA